MRAFAQLLENLLFSPDPAARLRLLAAYFRTTPDPDRGWALAVLTGGLSLPSLTPARIRGLVETRVDPVLFRLSHDHVGDLAETAALLWPAQPTGPVRLGEVIESLHGAGPVDAAARLADLLDRLEASERLALINLATGGIGGDLSGRHVRTALAALAADHEGRTLDRIEELWFGLTAPYADLFAWLGGGPLPQVDLTLALRPVMRGTPLAPAHLDSLCPEDVIAEWKWDGIRVQASSFNGQRRLYSHAGDDIGHRFPDVLDSMDWQGTVDGTVLVVRDDKVAPFADVQTRLTRKRVGKKTLADNPGHLRLHDLLHDGTHDLRTRSLTDRRQALCRWLQHHAPVRTDMSEDIPFRSWQELATIRAGARVAGQDGLMLRQKSAPYTGGQAAGQWYNWQRDALRADCVLVYARRGQGKQAAFYADYSFAAWRDGAAGPELVPVGKAASELADEDLARLDRWVRGNTVERFGPVRAVTPEIVLDVAFDAVQRSGRHKSGITLRAPRINRIRWHTAAGDADRLATLEAMIDG